MQACLFWTHELFFHLASSSIWLMWEHLAFCLLLSMFYHVWFCRHLDSFSSCDWPVWSCIIGVSVSLKDLTPDYLQGLSSWLDLTLACFWLSSDALCVDWNACLERGVYLPLHSRVSRRPLETCTAFMFLVKNEPAGSHVLARPVILEQSSPGLGAPPL